MKLERRCRHILFRELDSDEYFLRRLPPRVIGHFIDIGANVGLISIFIKLLNPNAKVLAIEPHPRVYKDLLANVSNLAIETKNIALGNGKPFYLFKERKTDLCNEFTDKYSDNISVPSKTFYRIILESSYPIDDLFIKLDCEGGEYYIFGDQDSEKILIKSKVLAIELHPKNEGDPKESSKYLSTLLKNTHNETKIQHSDRTINMIFIRKDLGV